MWRRIWVVALFAELIFGLNQGVGAASPELRGLWVEAGKPGIRSTAEISEVVRQARAAGFNALFVQVRKSGVAWYTSPSEMPAAEVVGGFDPLGEVLKQARVGEKNLEVHACVDMLSLGAKPGTKESGSNTVNRFSWALRRTEAASGSESSEVYLDPGVPEAQEYLVGVVREIVTRYPVDGICLGQWHYPHLQNSPNDLGWEANPEVIRRFQVRTQKTNAPSIWDPEWQQFRRDPLSAVLRRIYLETATVRPNARVSVECLTGVQKEYPIVWEQTSVYNRAFQDWRQWLREGIVDTAVLKFYFDSQVNPREAREWVNYLSANPTRRSVLPLVASHLNRAEDVLGLIRNWRAEANAVGSAGFGVFEYGTPSMDAKPMDFYAALRRPSKWDISESAVFSELASIPPMKWKTLPQRGQMLGRVVLRENPLDGASVELKGISTRLMSTDANGWFAAVDLTAGEYLVRVRKGLTNRVELASVVTVGNGGVFRPIFLDGLADPDGDGFSNADELTAGTDPQNRGSRLGADVTALADRWLLKVRPIVARRRYQLEASTDPSGPWRPVDASSSADGSEAVWPFGETTVYFRASVTY